MVNEYVAEVDDLDPGTLKEALQNPKASAWKAVKDKKVVKCKWILKTNLNADGSIERRKARLVAKGLTQIPGVDFDETHDPVTRIV